MSQPCRLNPNGCPGAPASLEWERSQNFGSVSVNSEGTAATTTKNRMSNAEMMKVGLRRRSCQASDHRLRGFPTSSGSGESPMVRAPTATSWYAAVGCEGSGSGSDISDPRVENGVQQVHEQIGEQVDDDQDGHERHDRGCFTAVDRLVERAADTVNVEDPLGHDRAAHQGAEVGTEVRHHRDQRVAQQVHRDDPPPWKALSDGRSHVVGVDVLDNRGAGQSHDVGERHGSEDDAGQQQLVPWRRTTDRGSEPSELDAHVELHQEADDEDGDGDDQQRPQQHARVEELAAPKAGYQAQRDTDEHLDDECHDGEPDRDGEGLAHDIDDLSTTERLTEVEGDDALHVLVVLVVQRLADVELRT